jgi:Ca2+-binding EF-hand superfamily protein
VIEETKHYSPHGIRVTRTYHSPREASPLKGFEEDELVCSLKHLITLENNLESAKENLALRPNFTIHDAFKIFDFSGYGKVIPVDVKDAFAKYGLIIRLEEAKLIVSRYDRDRSADLNFCEFSDMFYPIDHVSGQALDSRSHSFPNGYYLTADILDPITRCEFSNVLKLILDVENTAEEIRQKHSSRPLFDRIDAFDALNKFGDKFLTKQDFGDLLAKHRFFATDKELKMVMDRFDKNKDGKVSYGEFVDEITPHSPIRY